MLPVCRGIPSPRRHSGTRADDCRRAGGHRRRQNWRNLPEGKNLVGAFYPPRLVLTDPELLRTLPDREFRGGFAEVIKHAVIADAAMFAMLEKDVERILRRDRATLGRLIPQNIQIKARVVSAMNANPASAKF